MVKIEIYPTRTKKKKKTYRWRFRAPNGQIIATGHQRFANKANAKRAALNVATSDVSKQIVDMEKKKRKK